MTTNRFFFCKQLKNCVEVFLNWTVNHKIQPDFFDNYNKWQNNIWKCHTLPYTISGCGYGSLIFCQHVNVTNDFIKLIPKCKAYKYRQPNQIAEAGLRWNQYRFLLNIKLMLLIKLCYKSSILGKLFKTYFRVFYWKMRWGSCLLCK